MRKILSIFLCILIITAGISVYAANGDIAGYIYSTDIVAYIDGVAIPSYNIGGKTVVIAEELAPYGFEVIWDESSRRINIYTKAMPDTVPQYTPQKAKVSGRVTGYIYESDIVALVNGMWVESYNIGGRTALVIEDMASENDEAKRMSRDFNPHRDMGYSVSLMKAIWDESERTISLFCIRPGNVITTKYGDVRVNAVDLSSYHTGAYAFYDQEDRIINSWVSTIHYGDEVYICIDELNLNQNDLFKPVFDGFDASVENGIFNIKIPTQSIKNVLYNYASTRGACHNMLITLSNDLSINWETSKTETPDLILYRGKIFMGENAMNSSFGRGVISYKLK